MEGHSDSTQDMSRQAGTGKGTLSAYRLSLLRRRLIVRVLGAAFIISLIALAASQSVTSSPDTSKSDSKPSQANVQFDVVHESTTSSNSSVNDSQRPTVNHTTTLQTQSTSSSSGSSMSVTVNGQPVEVPQNGSTPQTITTPGGSTSVDIHNDTSGNGTTFNSSFSSTTQSNTTTDFDSHHVDQSFNSNSP